MNIDIFDFSLPKKHIAQSPKNIRSDSKLLVINRETDELMNEQFANIHEYFSKDDLLVINNTKVIPARLFGNRKKTNGRVEIFVERIIDEKSFISQLKSTRKLKLGDIIMVGQIELQIDSYDATLCKIVVTNSSVKILLNKYGDIPLPPYITRKPDSKDKKYYQTIFAEKDGSVAAPTAALHFDDSVIEKIKKKGVAISNITLHIGMGTFSTIKTQDIDKHKMHSELFCIPQTTLDLINKCKVNNGRVISVGTTVARALESFYSNKYEANKFYETDIFIKPGYDFKIVDSLITNFHLPQSSLLIMVAAFYDTERILKAYEYAIKNDYSFFSYGDSTLII
jgi:S-adenosylmethionine:tRNA ribosyltransferase-isomerase